MPIQSPSDRPLNLRAGEWVEVRSAGEILATLDAGQTVSALPFMPEMLQFCGKRFQVCATAHKTSDTIELFAIRRMANTVHLDGLRCNGSAHGGCQAACQFYWKECWLKRVSNQGFDKANIKEVSIADENFMAKLQELQQATRCSNGKSGCYRCQATEMLKATDEVRRRDRWNPLFYVMDLTSGNVKLWEFIQFGALAMLNSFLRYWFGISLPRVRGRAGDKTPSGELNLQPGEQVRVRSKFEIEQTLNRQLRNRGLWFDVEMVPYCGKGPFKVLQRVEKILGEKTGEMIHLPNPCIILEDVVCGGNLSHRRMFSRRREYIYWREIWLERMPGSVPVDQTLANTGIQANQNLFVHQA